MKKFIRDPINVCALLLLLVFFITCITSVLNKYTTVDESLYIVAGYAYLKTGDFRINIEHPVFMKALYGLPLLFLNPKLPIEKNENWNKSANIDVVANYAFASDFYIENLNMFRTIVFSARVVAIILATILSFLIFLWTKEAFGKKASLLALCIYCFEPNIIAHGSIAALDLPLTLFVFASFYFTWKFANSGRRRFLALSVISITFAVLTKYSGLIFIPLLMAFSLFYRKKLNEKFGSKAKTYYAIFFIAILITPIIFANIIYAFDHYKENIYLVIPSRVFEGYDFMRHWAEGGRDGWFFFEYRSYIPEYYLGAFLIKTTVPILILTALGFLLFVKRPNIEVLKILLPGLIFFILLSLFSRFYIGLRYALPAFPFLFAFIAGAFAPYLEKTNCGKKILLLIAVLLFWHIISSLSIYPHYLSYFNELIGGPANGLKYLSDSNIDWGQDFFYFMEFAKDRNWENPHLIYFGWPYPWMFMRFHWEDICEAKKERFAISATAIIGVIKDANCHRWLLNYEPKERIGWSIYYYEIDSEDINSKTS